MLSDNPGYESPPGRIHETTTNLLTLPLDEEIEPGTSTVPSINLAGNELFAHTNVLERFPQSFITEAEAGTNTELSMPVVEDPAGPSFQFLTTTDTIAQYSGCPDDTLFEQEVGELPVVRNKRQRPRYLLKSSISRKRPVLKFSATGHLDRDKTHYKWWCRV